MYIPLGNYDSNPIAVLNAKRTVDLPKVAVVTHFGKAFEKFINENNCKLIDTIYLETTETYIYVVEIEGNKLALVKPLIGAPMTTNTIEHLVTNGVKAIVACDDLYSNNSIDIGKVIVPSSVIRGDGTSMQYARTSKRIMISKSENEFLINRLNENNIEFEDKEILTTDIRRNNFQGIYGYEGASTLAISIFRDIETIYFGYVREKNGRPQSVENKLLNVALKVASDMTLNKEFNNKHKISNDSERYKVEVESTPIKIENETSLPNTVVICFFEEIIDEYKNKTKCKEVPISIRGITFNVYVANINGQEIGFVQGLIGSSGSAILMEELASYGVKNILACGGAGVLENEEKALYVPIIGLKNDGVSTNLAFGDFIESDKTIVNIIKKYFEKKSFKCISCATWTTDASRRETRDTIDSRVLDINKRIYPETMPILVEMEFSSLLATAKRNQINFGQVLYGGDKLFKGKEYDENNWTKDSIRGFLFKSVLDLASNFEKELENNKNFCR